MTVLDRPIVVVGAPHSGVRLVLEALGRAPGLLQPRRDVAPVPDAVDDVARPDGSHRLDAADAARGDVAVRSRAALLATLVDATGEPGDAAAPGARVLIGGRRLALRVPFLHAVLPDARFVLAHRDPALAMPAVLDVWRAGQARGGTADQRWTLPRVPGWRALVERPTDEIAAEQWRAIAELALDDLEALEPHRWSVVDRDTLVADPEGELRRLCRFLDLPFDTAMLSPVEEVRGLDAVARGPVPAPRPALVTLRERMADLLAEPPEPGNATSATGAGTGSRFTLGFARALAATGSSLLLGAPHLEALIAVAERDRLVASHVAPVDRPGGIAAGPDRVAVAARTEVWELEDREGRLVPAARRATGDLGIGDAAWVGGVLWLAAPTVSCLVSAEGECGVRERWRPPWVTSVTQEDRCHLNGMAVDGERVTHVTAYGISDTRRGWVAERATGGVLADVASGAVVCGGLAMPRSPRWHDGRLWLLEGGRGALCVTDLEAGTCEVVAELPGFAAGLAISGSVAFVGVSQLREARSRGDLPLTQRLGSRRCGVWAVDLVRGAVLGSLRFEDRVQELSDVALLAGVRDARVEGPGGPGSVLLA